MGAIALVAILCSCSPSEPSSPPTVDSSVVESRDIERPESELVGIADGFSLGTVNIKGSDSVLSFLKPESWEPLTPEYLTTSNEKITTVKYGNGNSEFIEIAFGEFSAEDQKALILTPHVTQVSDKKDIVKNVLFEKISADSKESSISVFELKDNSEEVIPINVQRDTIGDNLFDTFSFTNTQGVSFSVVLYHMKDSGSLPDDSLSNLVESFRIIDSGEN